MDQIRIGAFLKELRKEKGLTQEQLAEQLGVSGRTISRWETGNNMPDISLLTEIADLFSVSITELIDGERKNGEMKDETKEIAGRMADYADSEKAVMIRNIRNHSLYGVCAFVILLVLELAVPEGKSTAADVIHVYCETLVYVSLIMICMISTGILQKLERKQRGLSLPKPVLLLITAVAGAAAAFLIRYLFLIAG